MKGKVGAVFLGIVFAVVIIMCFMCMERVPAGYVGVVYNMSGGVDGEVLTQGWHLVSPTKKGNNILYRNRAVISYIGGQGRLDQGREFQYSHI